MFIFEEKQADGAGYTTYCRDKQEAQERAVDAWMRGNAARYYHADDEATAPNFVTMRPMHRDNFNHSATVPGKLGR